MDAYFRTSGRSRYHCSAEYFGVENDFSNHFKQGVTQTSQNFNLMDKNKPVQRKRSHSAIGSHRTDSSPCDQCEINPYIELSYNKENVTVHIATGNCVNIVDYSFAYQLGIKIFPISSHERRDLQSLIPSN